MKNEQEVKEALAKPFEEIFWKVQGKAITIDKVDYQDYAPYIKAPQIAERLNEVLGPMNWDCLLEYNNETSTKCDLALRFGEKQSVKSGIGTAHKKPSDIDHDKTKESDALKRAAIKNGIGAHIKEIPLRRLRVKIKAGKVAHAFTDDGQELHGNEAINAYCNNVRPEMGALRFIAKTVPEELKPEFKKLWDFFKS